MCIYTFSSLEVYTIRTAIDLQK